MSSQETLSFLVDLMRRRKDDAASSAKPVFWLGAGCSIHDGVPLNDTLLDVVLARSSTTWGSRQYRFDRLCDGEGAGQDRAAFLMPHLKKPITPDSPYHTLVRLARDGYLDVICTFNIDDLIDQAFDAAGMREYQDYLAIDVAKTLPEAVASQIDATSGPRIRILKMHGDYRSGFNFMTSGEIAKYNPTIDTVVKDCSRRLSVICGYSFFHLNVLNSFSLTGGPMFYVNRSFPEAPMVLSLMALRSPGRANFIDKPLGLFGTFVRSLREMLDSTGGA